jgi:hypothetical protein
MCVIWVLGFVCIGEAGAGQLCIFPWEGRAGLALCPSRLGGRSQRSDRSSLLAY